MIRFEKLAPTEKGYPFEDAIAADSYINGTFGDVAEGKFTKGDKFKAIMQVEKGDNANSGKFKVEKGEHVRVVDFNQCDGAIVNITSDNIKSYATTDKGYKVDTDGMLTKDDTLEEASGFKVIEHTDYGVRATVSVRVAAE